MAKHAAVSSSDRASKHAPAQAEDNTPDWTLIAKLQKSKLDLKVHRLAEIAKEMTALKAEADDLKAEGFKILTVAGVKSVLVDGMKATAYEVAGRASIKRDLLLKYGVSEKVIQKATKKGKGYVAFKVTVPGEEKAGAGYDDGDE